MPQIDFGTAFADPTRKNADPSGSARGSHEPTRENIFVPAEPSKFRRSRLGRSDWANIIFVIITVLGGLFCAFYFFNGAELIQSASAWPSEFLYPRPIIPGHGQNLEAGLLPNDEQMSLEQNSRDKDRAPFRRSATELLNLSETARQGFAASTTGGDYAFASPSTPPGVAPPGITPPGATPPADAPPGSNPPGVNPPGVNPPVIIPPVSIPPGCDRLTQILNQEVAHLQRAVVSDTHRTVVVVERRVANTERGAFHTVRKTLDRLRLPAAPPPGKVAGNVATMTNSTVRSTLGTVRNVTSGPVGTSGNVVSGATTAATGVVGTVGGITKGAVGGTGVSSASGTVTGVVNTGGSVVATGSGIVNAATSTVGGVRGVVTNVGNGAGVGGLSPGNVGAGLGGLGGIRAVGAVGAGHGGAGHGH